MTQNLTSGFSNIITRWKNGYPQAVSKASGFPVTPLAHPYGATIIDDFSRFDVADDYTVTAVGVSTETISGPTGILTLLNAAANDDSDQIQLNWEFFKLQANKAAWFQCRLKMNEVTQSDLFVGLAITDTTLFTGPSDAIAIIKENGNPSLKLKTIKNSLSTVADTTIDMVDDTYIDLGIYMNGTSAVTAFINGVKTVTNTNLIPDDEDLTFSLAVRNGEAVAKSVSIDYWRVDIER